MPMVNWVVMKWAKKQTGFTIVELLIVIVVIAILAAITIVAYNGIQNRAKQSSTASAASQALKKIEAFKSASDTEDYPTSAAEAGTDKISGASYFFDTPQKVYCVQTVSGNITYSATNTAPTPIERPCTENGLVGWWRFNGNGDDSSGNGFSATVTGALAVGQNGQANGAYNFNGAPPSATVANSQDILTPSNTFSFWYYADTWNSGAATSFVAKRGGTTTGHFIMRLTSSNTLAFDCGGSGNRYTSGTTLPTGAWTHIVITCSPTNVLAYVNGVRGSLVNRTTSPLYNTTLLQFGQDNSGYGLNGRMDDIRLYSRVITPQEVQALYAAGAQ